MMTFKFMTPVCIFFTCNLTTNASILIVDNHVPTPAGAYATIQLAHDAASAGDTLMLVPSETEYAGISITKTIHIIGNGWDRPATDMPFTKTSGFTINAESVSIQGLKINGNCNLQRNYIIFKRNYLSGVLLVGSVSLGVTGISILQNFIVGGPNTLQVFKNSSSIISNNVIFSTYQFATNNAMWAGFPSTIIIKNNILKTFTSNCPAINIETSGNSFNNQEIANNIVITGSTTGVSTPNNNIGNATQFPATSGNLQDIDMSTVFVDMANNDFHLKAGSPAIGAGENGTDCGIYGGELGFVDKGVPGLPYIYFLQVPSIANKKDGLNVTVKAKSGN